MGLTIYIESSKGWFSPCLDSKLLINILRLFQKDVFLSLFGIYEMDGLNTSGLISLGQCGKLVV
jgi:hypothetical protein